MRGDKADVSRIQGGEKGDKGPKKTVKDQRGTLILLAGLKGEMTAFCFFETVLAGRFHRICVLSGFESSITKCDTLYICRSNNGRRGREDEMASPWRDTEDGPEGWWVVAMVKRRRR